MGTLFFVAPILLLIPYVGIELYNDLVARRNAVANAFASMDVQLQKRYELIPNLVEVVKASARHERDLLDHVIQLHNAAMQSSTAQARQSADEELSKLLPQLLAIAESSPALRASGNFLHLQKSLNEVEEQLAAARRSFNSCVTAYNNAVESFPSSLIASNYHFKKTDWFQISDAERQAPNLSGKFEHNE